MHNLIKRKTFSKILVAVHESFKSADTAVDYAIKVAQDYDAKLIILYIIRANTNLHTVNSPSHIIQLKKQAQAYLT